jgi:hypothetical protein
MFAEILDEAQPQMPKLLIKLQPQNPKDNSQHAQIQQVRLPKAEVRTEHFLGTNQAP